MKRGQAPVLSERGWENDRIQGGREFSIGAQEKSAILQSEQAGLHYNPGQNREGQGDVDKITNFYFCKILSKYK